MRAEHWYDFGTSGGGRQLFSLAIARVATASIHDAVLQYSRAGQAFTEFPLRQYFLFTLELGGASSATVLCRGSPGGH